ncbi:hypothetical protein AFE_0417 [Acidithiobacillus ferrooxidans ATCC 23270]|uniref:Uncharacterized protein n=1 Tax=Acidithiobacillus ferrooxidans (strain ATCC 23270 / DSM 14882 / CIP 104768 / NCIMB 8455) TaxID=243159 RepID=B7J4G0_ACIF2|nr:hypothetical protein AFE_0417 [Acidithiobacillus ferrooxidans ATCC 23270]
MIQLMARWLTIGRSCLWPRYLRIYLLGRRSSPASIILSAGTQGGSGYLGNMVAAALYPQRISPDGTISVTVTITDGGHIAI